LASLWLAAAGVLPADAQSEERKKELRAKFDAAANSMEASEKTAIGLKLAAYLDARKAALEKLWKIVEEGSEDKRDQAKEWENEVTTMRGTANTCLGHALDSVREPTVWALAFVNTTFAEEDAFWETLRTQNAGQARDFVLQCKTMIAELTKSQDAKWKQMLDDDNNGFDEQEKRQIADLRKLVEDSARELAEKHRTFTEGCIGVAKRVSKVKYELKIIGKCLEKIEEPHLKVIGVVISEVTKLTDEFVKYHLPLLEAMMENFQKRSGEYKTLTEREGAAFVIYQQARALVKEFLDKNPFDLAKEKWRRSQQEFGSARSGLKSAGQQSDWDALGAGIMSRLSAHLDGTQKVYEEFVRRHEGIFFGPIKQEIKEALAEVRQGEQEVRWWLDQDIDGRLRRWTSEVDALSRALDDGWECQKERDKAKELLKEHIEKLMATLKRAENQMSDSFLELLFRRENLARRLEQ